MAQTNPWQPEFEVNQSLVRQLINEQFPDLRPKTVTRFGQGWDNIAYLINDQLVFRFPCRKIAGDIMSEEIKILPKIHNQLPLPIPKLQYIGHPTNYYPWQFSGYCCLLGTTACRASLSDQERGAIAKPLAKFLKILHSSPLTHLAQNVNLKCDIHQKANPTFRVPFTQKLISSLVDRQLISTSRDRKHFLDECALITPEYLPCLVHGDLYARHLLVDHNNNLNGIIDWGDAHLGHAATDLGIVYGFIPKEYHKEFWSHYGEVSVQYHQLAKLRALYSSAMLMDYSDKINDSDLLREGRWFIDRFEIA